MSSIGSYDNNVAVESFPPSAPNTVINTCPQGQLVVLERFGRMHRVEQPGLFFAVPFVDRLAYVVDMRELTLAISPQSAITKDNVSVDVGGALFVQVVDPVKACYGVRRVLVAIKTHAISAMRTTIGSVELDELLHNRHLLNERLQEQLVPAAEPWGLSVKRLELTEIHPDSEVSRAMDAQATAERRKRERILQAEGVREQHIRESEGVRQEQINHAEGQRQKTVLLAEARRDQQILEAEGHAEALERVATALAKPGGKDAMSFYLAESYMRMVGAGLHETSTVFIPEDIGDVSQVIAKGMGVAQTLAAKGVNMAPKAEQK